MKPFPAEEVVHLFNGGPMVTRRRKEGVCCYRRGKHHTEEGIR